MQDLDVQESGLVQEKYLPDLEMKLVNLESEAKKVIDGRLDSHAKIEDYRTLVSLTHNWLDGIANKLQTSEKGAAGLLCQQKIDLVKNIGLEFTGGYKKLADLNEKAADITKDVSSIDSQAVQEQLSGLDRRFAEMRKRIDRRNQLLESTNKNFENFKKDLGRCKALEGFSPNMKIGYDVQSAEALQATLKSKIKDLDGQQVILSTLERRLNSIRPELEVKEIKDAEDELTAVIGHHSALSDELRRTTLGLNDALISRRKFLEDTERVKGWTGRLSNDLVESSTHPLHAVDVEREINELKVIQGNVL